MNAEQLALIGIAATRMRQFAVKRTTHTDALAVLTEVAPQDAITGGVPPSRLAAELDLSSAALNAILRRDPPLVSLHGS